MASTTKLVIVLLVILLIATGAGILYYVQSQPKPAQKVTFMMDIFVYGPHSIFYPALSQGYYNDQGLQVSIVPGQGSYSTAQSVGSGAATFGFANSGAAMIAISQGTPIRIIGMINHLSPCALLTLNSSGIKSPMEVEGKIVGGAWGTGACEKLFPGFANQIGINVSKVTEATLSIQSLLPTLLAGKIDAAIGFTSATYIWNVQVVAEHKQLLSFNWTNYGFDLYGNAIITNNQTINNNPDLVSKFLKATYEGILWAYKNETGAAQIMRQYNPSLTETYNETVGLTRWTFSNWNQTLIEEALSTNNPRNLGLMEQAKMQTTLDWVVTYQGIKSFPINESYTNQFLTS